MKRWVIFSLSLILFLIISYLVSRGVTTSFDMNIYKIITFSNNNIFTSFLKFVTFFGGEYAIILVIVLSFILIKNKRYSFCILLDGVFIVLLNYIVKNLFMRDRPFDLMIIKEDGYSFPSGHSMVSAGIYGFLIYLIWKSNFSKKIKIIFTVCLLTLILLIGISRIYLGVHFPTDVLAGYLFSISFLIVFTFIIEKRKVI
ncbi:MAG: phosphatase PAP2 family protein [Bacilli bacterium]|nr:phosphatase PAP2 family protein [Bacilli bacterium]